eukprot:TRINITY_DN3545_c0_g3_i1.p1 TRINITY_DN3545_c0_g3~~TRINITY_DN3545_c0_g3_i1.p1  ORF type:complete len:377 (+),score=134.00 TRINITY_DN3545_c0_g3_i1:54-1184(+)
MPLSNLFHSPLAILSFGKKEKKESTPKRIENTNIKVDGLSVEEEDRPLSSSPEVPDIEKGEEKKERDLDNLSLVKYEESSIVVSENDSDGLFPADNPSHPSINVLPMEILEIIFKMLDGTELYQCSQVCTFWKKEAEKQSLWMNICKKNNMYIFWQKDKLPDSQQNWREVWKWHIQVNRTTFPSGAKDKNGFGIDSTESTGTYLGEWINNKKEGRGIHIWNDKSRYEGEWKNDKRNGYGVYYWGDGRKFDGIHTNDKRSSGIFYWPEGSTYEGEYMDSCRQGWGKFTWPDGDVYEGTWQKGARNGVGTYTCIQPGMEGTWMQRTWDERSFDFFNKGTRNPEDEVFPEDSRNKNKRKNEETSKMEEDERNVKRQKEN